MSERLPNNEWLHLAKATPIGGRNRCRHLKERRHNLVVGNEADRWWAYCQGCKAGGVELKTHVLLGSAPPAASTQLSLPVDAMAISALSAGTRDQVLRFLAGKNMDLLYFRGLPISFSESRKRLLIDTPSGLMGRDVTERSPQKWLTYNGQHYLSSLVNMDSSVALLVEDAFSWAKVSYAIGTGAIPAAVYCTLGTRIHDSLFLECLRKHTRVISFYDGDGPGYAGQRANDKRIRAANLRVSLHENSCAPFGFDPKDMNIADIQMFVKRQFMEPGLLPI